MSGSGSSDDNIQWARSKDRVLSLIAQNYRVRADDGELMQPDAFRDDFDERFKECATLDSIWREVGGPIRQSVRKAVEHPTVDVDLGEGKSWKQYDQSLIDYLDRGETITLPETGLAPRYGAHASKKFVIR